jgi:RecB family endonuclease NucS
MLLIYANLSAHYSGRSDTLLSEHDRLVVLKSDGSVSIHADKGYKPVNYMASVVEFEEILVEGILHWNIWGKNEELEIIFHRIYTKVELKTPGEDLGHSLKAGSEKDVQDWIIENLLTIDPTLDYIGREYQTGAGPVDILASRGEKLVAIEVKKVAPMNTVGQVLRYTDALEETHPEKEILGIIMAVEFKPRTLTLAANKGIECVTIEPVI